MEKVVENVYTYLSARNLIQNDFWMRSEKNPSFSLRSYSQKISVSSGFLSQYLSGKKNISGEKIEAVFKNLGFNEDEIQYGLAINEYENHKNKNELPERLKKFIKGHYEMVESETLSPYSSLSDSKYHFLLSMFINEKPQSEDELFSKVGRIIQDKELFLDILKDYERDGMIERSDAGVSRKNVNYIITESNLRIIKNNLDVSNFIHNEILRNGDYDLKHTSNALTVRIKKDQLQIVRDITTKCLHDLMRLNSNNNDDETFVTYSQEYVIID